MRRRLLLQALPLTLLRGQTAAPAAGPDPHLPGPLYRYVWRNWELVPVGRLAAAIGARPAQLTALAASLGLPPQRPQAGELFERLIPAILRRNRDLLDAAQLTALTGRAPSEPPPPGRPPLRYTAPTPAQKRHAAGIRLAIERSIPGGLRDLGAPRMAFAVALAAADPAPPRTARPDARTVILGTGWDVVPPPAAAPALQAAATRFQAFLATARGGEKGRLELALTPGGPAFGPGGFRVRARAGQIRLEAATPRGLIRGLAGLRREMLTAQAPVVAAGDRTFAERAAPRLAPPFLPADLPLPEGYLDRLATAGAGGLWLSADLAALEDPARRAILATQAERAAAAGLLFYLRLQEPQPLPEEFFRAHPGWRGARFADGYLPCLSVPEARAWFGGRVRAALAGLPGVAGLWAPAEDGAPRHCRAAGVREACPRCSGQSAAALAAQRLETLRAQAELRTEPVRADLALLTGFPGVPYLPALPRALAAPEPAVLPGAAGGFPSPLLRSLLAGAVTPAPSPERVLRREAALLYGAAGVAGALSAWAAFSDTLARWPAAAVLETPALRLGPARRPGPEPAPASAPPLDTLLRPLLPRWQEGIAQLLPLVAAVPRPARAPAALELAAARAFLHHVASAANQCEIERLRREAPAAGSPREAAVRARLVTLYEEERELARRHFTVAAEEPLIGYDPAEGYLYTPADLLEKIIFCEQALAHLLDGRPLDA